MESDMLRKIQRLIRSEDGPTAVEYAILLALLVVMCLSAISVTGGPVKAFWQGSSESLKDAVDE